MLILCDTCNGRGTVARSDEAPVGVCPTCHLSGFSNATSEQARQAEIVEAQLTRETAA